MEGQRQPHLASGGLPPVRQGRGHCCVYSWLANNSSLAPFPTFAFPVRSIGGPKSRRRERRFASSSTRTQESMRASGRSSRRDEPVGPASNSWQDASKPTWQSRTNRVSSICPDCTSAPGFRRQRRWNSCGAMRKPVAMRRMLWRKVSGKTTHSKFATRCRRRARPRARSRRRRRRNGRH